MAGQLDFIHKSERLDAGGKIVLEQFKGLLIVSSLSGGWCGIYNSSFGEITEIAVDDRTKEQISVALLDSHIEITNKLSSSRVVGVVLIGYTG